MGPSSGLVFGVLVCGDGCVGWCCHGGISEIGLKKLKNTAWNWKVEVMLRLTIMVDALVPWLMLHLSVTAERV